MTDTITATFQCPTCQGEITWPDDATDETPIACKTCDVTYGTYAEMKELFAEKAKAAVMDKLKSGLGPGWKLS
jgi:endogenous inhibitor of DNA gyrase (YacG/DUF329 family)